MRVLITGITGLIGSHLADYLLTKEDVKVYGFKRWRSSVENISHLEGRVTFLEGDIEDPISVEHAIASCAPDRIFHLAAQSYPSESWKAPIITFNTNVIGTINLLEAVRKLGFDSQIHIACSSAEYGFVHPEEMPIKEDHPLRPLSPYGVSKVAQELSGIQYHLNYGMRVYLTRFFNQVGPRQGDRCSIQTFSKQIAEIEKGRRQGVVYVGNLSPRRDFLDVRDGVRALWLLLGKGRPAEVYNLCSGEARQMQWVLDRLLEMANVKVEVVIDPARLRPSDEPILVGDNTKLIADTGWRPEIPFQQTLKDILDYWRKRV